MAVRMVSNSGTSRCDPFVSSPISSCFTNAASPGSVATNRDHRYRCGRRRLDGHRLPALAPGHSRGSNYHRERKGARAGKADEMSCACSNLPDAAMFLFSSAGKLLFPETRSSPPSGATRRTNSPASLFRRQRAQSNHEARLSICRSASRMPRIRCRSSPLGPLTNLAEAFTRLRAPPARFVNW